MTVNEEDNRMDAFISGNTDAFIDRVTFYDDVLSLPDFLQTNDLNECEILVDQQPTKKSYFIPKGVIVRLYDNNQVKLCEVISNDLQNNIKHVKPKY